MVLSPKKIAEWPRRWRCSAGFGVHSPFAFSFIHDTLRQRRYGYYAYDSIGTDSVIRLWFRIVCRFQPKTVSVNGVIDRYRFDDIIMSASLASPSIRVTSQAADLSWWGRDMLREANVPVGKIGILTGASSLDVERVFRLLDFGMCFTNASGMAVIVAFEHLPHQRFDLFF